MKVTQIYNPNFKDDYTIALNYQQQLKKLGCDSNITDTIDGAMTGLIHVHCPINALVLGELKIPYIFTIHQYYIDNNIYDFLIIEKSIKGSTISLYYSETLPKSLINNKVFSCGHPSPLSAYNGFFGNGVFTRIYEYFDNNNLEQINW